MAEVSKVWELVDRSPDGKSATYRWIGEHEYETKIISPQGQLTSTIGGLRYPRCIFQCEHEPGFHGSNRVRSITPDTASPREPVASTAPHSPAQNGAPEPEPEPVRGDVTDLAEIDTPRWGPVRHLLRR